MSLGQGYAKTCQHGQRPFSIHNIASQILGKVPQKVKGRFYNVDSRIYMDTSFSVLAFILYFEQQSLIKTPQSPGPIIALNYRTFEAFLSATIKRRECMRSYVSRSGSQFCMKSWLSEERKIPRGFKEKTHMLTCPHVMIRSAINIWGTNEIPFM